jgi:SagB-type dehydrogenase family enzyme
LAAGIAVGVVFAIGTAWGQAPTTGPLARPTPITPLVPALTPVSTAPLPIATPTLRVLGSVALPAPDRVGKVSLERVLAVRRSVRRFRREALTMAQLGQLLWAAQGVTDKAQGLRTAPSAGQTYPLEIYFVTGTGHYHYVPRAHRIEQLGFRDIRSAVAKVAGGQDWLSNAGAIFVLAADPARADAKFRERAPRYICFEAGHAAQNMLLQATAMGLAAVPLGAFYDETLSQLLNIPPDQIPLYTVAVGVPETPIKVTPEVTKTPALTPKKVQTPAAK